MACPPSHYEMAVLVRLSPMCKGAQVDNISLAEYLLVSDN